MGGVIMAGDEGGPVRGWIYTYGIWALTEAVRILLLLAYFGWIPKATKSPHPAWTGFNRAST